jgi:uncharacterized protein YndB with AHSA1/START domain
MAEHDVKVTKTIRAGTDRVWAALTQPELVKKWMMGATLSTTWTRGAPITWTGDYEGKKYQDKGEVLEVEQHKQLAYTHFSAMSGAADKPENYHQVSWQLKDENGSTTLQLVQTGASSAKEAEQFKSNWKSMLDSLREVAEAG